MRMKFKVNDVYQKDVANHYREQLKIIQEKRSNGEVGYIDFVSYQ